MNYSFFGGEGGCNTILLQPPKKTNLCVYYSIEVTKKICEKVFKYSNFIKTFSYKLRNYINYLNYLSSFYSLNIMNSHKAITSTINY